eukprot:CAMPEP_0201989198 /NCGR_PEP_ID=MMETSP0904-20121228/92728_1 /ASSEMBLY_ACC=CAM_ASM_000553 /TAXON_ID=420261 /ORGANISM="Thalassiosira antarctica, Strain CCMP982" /LENGTH=473 /DNA_ID=CAMNT_0048543409 /DNA_START=81 /DNA_END=1502 /DNA_ORIENTATION=+
MRYYQISALLLSAAGTFTAHAFAPATPRSPAAVATITDLTKIGSLTVPLIGCGTIAWTSDKVTGRPNPELEELVSIASKQGGGFFDTGERYGSHMKTALGMGWGETERLVKKLTQDADDMDSSSSTPVVATKFTPSPWRTTVDSVVEACEESRKRLGMGWGETERLVKKLTQDADDMDSSSSTPVVATKFTPSPWRTTVDSVVEACEESRKRLGVESIDLYQIQMPDIVKPLRSFGFDKAYDEVYWDGLAECYHKGLVKNVGVSNYGPTLVSRCHEHLAKRGVPLASNQIAFSLIGRHNGAQQTLDRCNELGVKVLAYYPFAMGLLTGKYTSTSPGMSHEDALTNSLSTSRRSNFERKDLERYANGDVSKGIPAGGVAPLLRTMERIATERGATVAQVALNYIICKGAIPIPGARTAAQYVDNMGALNWRLTKREVNQMEKEADNLGISFDGAGFKRSDAKFVGYGMEKWSLT